MGEVNFSAAYLKKYSTAGKKKDNTGHFRYTRDTMIRYVERKVKEMIMKNKKPEMNDLIIKPEMNDLIIDCAIVSHGQGVMNIKWTNTIEE